LEGSDLQQSSFTNTGAKIYAPGENIYSTKINNTYGEDEGTSFAAAHVSGAAALLSFFMRAAQESYNFTPVNQATLTNALVSMSSDREILNVLSVVTYTSHMTFFNSAILTPEQDADVSGVIKITTQITGYYDEFNDYDLGYFKLQYKAKDTPNTDASYTDIQTIEMDKGDYSKYSVNWDTSRLPNGEYTIEMTVR
jgi:hypothetical protein